MKLKGQIEKENEKAKKLKSTLAKKSRQLRTAERRLDEIPSRAELDQYQKRFLELYDESAAIHRYASLLLVLVLVLYLYLYLF